MTHKTTYKRITMPIKFYMNIYIKSHIIRLKFPNRLLLIIKLLDVCVLYTQQHILLDIFIMRFSIILKILECSSESEPEK